MLLFGLTSFLASVLLFSAEPMIGKMVLPLFGGTPAVWNTCLVYFQVILLAAMSSWAEARSPRDTRSGSSPLRSCSRSACSWPSGGPFLRSCADRNIVGLEHLPAARLFWTLATSASLPLLMVAAAAPLVQKLVRR